MPGISQPLSKQFPIVDDKGNPTTYFIRWAQQRQIDISDGITAAQAQQLIDEWSAAHSVNAGTGLSGGGTFDTNPTLQLDAGLGNLNDVDLSTPPTDQQVLVYDDASSLWVPADQSGGGGGAGTRKEARVSLTADYGRAGGSDLNVFDPAHTSVNFDNASFWDAVNAQFVIPSGITQVRVSCIIAQTGSANFGIRIKKNGTNVALLGDNTNKFKYCSTGVLSVTAGDVIQVAGFSSTGWTVAYGSGSETWTWASIEDVSLLSGSGGGGNWWFSPPTAASFSLQSADANQLILTDDADVGLLVDGNTPISGDSTRRAYRTLTDKTKDWVCTVKIEPFLVNTHYSNIHAIDLSDSVGGRLISLIVGWDGTYARYRFNGLSGFNSSVAFTQVVDRMPWFRISSVSGTLTYYLSKDGKIWTAMLSESNTSWLANPPDRIGLGIDYNRTTGLRTSLSCPYFSLTGPAV